MKVSWPTSRLGDEARFISGGTPKKSVPEYWNGDIPWVGSGEMASRFISDTAHRLTLDGVANGVRLVPKGTVLAVVRGMSLAKEFRVALTTRDVTFNQDVKAIVPSESIRSRFLFYYLLSQRERIRQSSTEASHGTKKLELQVLKNWPVPLPDTEVQDRIVEVIGAYDDLIENNRRRIQLLEESARLLYWEWFVHLRFPGHEHVRLVDGVPEGWKKISLNGLVKTQYGYTESASKDSIGPKFLRGTDINKSAYIDWSGVPYCSCSDHDLRKYRLEVGDLVVIRMADPGKVAIIEKDVEAVFASYLIRLSIVGDIKPYYLFYTLREGGYQEYMGGAATGSTRKSASAKVLTDYDVLVPSNSLMSEFEEYVRVIRKQINCLLDQNAALARARDLLLPRLMNGEIAV